MLIGPDFITVKRCGLHSAFNNDVRLSLRDFNEILQLPTYDKVIAMCLIIVNMTCLVEYHMC